MDLVLSFNSIVASGRESDSHAVFFVKKLGHDDVGVLAVAEHGQQSWALGDSGYPAYYDDDSGYNEYNYIYPSYDDSDGGVYFQSGY